MRINLAGLLHQFSLEYNNLINTEASNFAPQYFDEIGEDNNIIASGDNSGEEEMDDRLETIKDEMCLLISGMSRKRRQTVKSDRFIQNRKRRQKYNTKNLHFTNLFTMERQVCIFEYSIGYANCVLDTSPDNKNGVDYFENGPECHIMPS